MSITHAEKIGVHQSGIKLNIRVNFFKIGIYDYKQWSFFTLGIVIVYNWQLKKKNV